MQTVCSVLSFIILNWHRGNRMINPEPVSKPQWILIKRSLHEKHNNNEILVRYDVFEENRFEEKAHKI